jgi:hypothetical protein
MTAPATSQADWRVVSASHFDASGQLKVFQPETKIPAMHHDAFAINVPTVQRKLLAQVPARLTLLQRPVPPSTCFL